MKVRFHQNISLFILVVLLILNNERGYSQNLQSNSIEINFAHYVGNENLKLDRMIYKNVLNQDFSVTKFKYYISDIVLSRKDGKPFVCNNYFLVDEKIPGSKKIVLDNVPRGEYIAVQFTVGVDSIHNCSGAQSGALDPINGMFWTWNTGYIFMKLEGISEFSSAPNALLEYHIGGFKQPHNCIRTISLPLNASLLIPSSDKNSIEIKTDILEMLKTPTSIDFSKLPTVSDFNNATTVADNYSDMFSVLK
jgi:hypothetical protein